MGKKIMVVDDSRMIALQMQNLLEDTEYEIAVYCRNGEDALAKYGEIRPDIVTMDIIMPASSSSRSRMSSARSSRASWRSPQAS